MKIGILETTCQSNNGVYFGQYEIYKSESGYTTYNLNTGISQLFTSLDKLKDCFNDDKSIVNVDYHLD